MTPTDAMTVPRWIRKVKVWAVAQLMEIPTPFPKIARIFLPLISLWNYPPLLKKTDSTETTLAFWNSQHSVDCFSLHKFTLCPQGFTDGSDDKESACNAGNLGSIPGLRSSSGEGNGYPLQYSCLGNFMDRGALWAIAHGVTKSWTRLKD